MRDETETLQAVRRELDGSAERADKYKRIAEIVREAREYRWVGLYDVAGGEIVAVAWSGPSAPAHPRFSASEGLCGDAARRRRPVVVADVTRDARYKKTLDDTRSEIVVPVLELVTGRARVLIDVESDRENAFSEADRRFLERCAAELATAVSASPG